MGAQLITADQLLAHAIGDYILQSHWMATEKTKRWMPALVHGASYTIPFILLTSNWLALFVIMGSHEVIDHYRLAKWVVWLKNQLLQPQPLFIELDMTTGYPAESPIWLATWLLIIADNTMHILINGAALKWL